MQKYQGRLEYVLAAYNAGGLHLDRWRKRYPNAQILLFSDLIPFKETRNYVSIIQRNAYWYGRLLTDQTKDSLSHLIYTRSEQSLWRAETVNNLLNISWNKAPPTSKEQLIAELFQSDRFIVSQVATTTHQSNSEAEILGTQAFDELE